MREIRTVASNIEDPTNFSRQVHAVFVNPGPFDIQTSLNVIIEVIACFRLKEVPLIAIDYLYTYSRKLSPNLQAVHPGYLNVIFEKIDDIMGISIEYGTRLIAALEVVLQRCMGDSLYYYPILGYYVQACSKYFLQDYCVEFVAFPRMLDVVESIDEDYDRSKATSSYFKYLGDSIEINRFMGNSREAGDFTSMVIKEDSRMGNGNNFFSDILNSGRSVREKKRANLEMILNSIDQLNETSMQNISRGKKEEGTGHSGLLMMVKGSAEEESKDFVEITENITELMASSSPSIKKAEEILKSPIATKFGITWSLIQRLFFREVNKNFQKFKDSYTNYYASKLLTGVSSDLMNIPQFMRSLTEVVPIDE